LEQIWNGPIALIKKSNKGDYAMQNNLGELLEKEVYPALWDRLDTAFPEFGFKRKGDHWIATDESASRRLSGSPRPERVWVYSDSPFGIKIHGGEFITWIVYVSGHSSPRGLEFITAVRELCQRSGVLFPEMERPANSTPKEKSIETFHDDMYRWGREQLLSNPGKLVLEYLFSRGLNREEIEERTDLCAIPHRKKLTEEFLNQKGYKIDHLKESGLLAWGFGINYQLFFPVRDAYGNIVSWAGRLIVPGKDKNGDDLPKYKNTFGLHKNLPYNFSRAKMAIERTKQVIIVEGFMDAAHTFAKGFENVVAILGSRLLSDQLRNLVSAGASQILMCLDRDKDGEEGTELAFDQFGLFPEINPYFVYLPPNCKDADETLKKFTKSDFEQMLKSAQPGWLWYAERIGKAYQNNPDRDPLLNQYASIYNKIANPVIKNEFIKTISKETEIGILTLRKRFGEKSRTKVDEKKSILLEQFGRCVADIDAIFKEESNLMQVRQFINQKLSMTRQSSSHPVYKHYRNYLKSCLMFCNRFDVDGMKQITREAAGWVSEQDETTKKPVISGN
jgi:DNA primase catalytic core